MKNRVAVGDLMRVVRPAVVGISILALACLVGTASAGTKSKKDAAADAEKSHKKVLVMSDKGERTFLGVTMQGLDDDLRKGLDVTVKQGVLVIDVMEGSPAEEAGIESGDVIVEFKGRKVESPSELRDMVIRDKRTKTFTVTLGSYGDEEEWSFVTPEYLQWFDDGKHAFVGLLGRARLGVSVADVNEGLAPYFGVKQGEGVLVLDVTEGTPGHKMGIKSGDVIVRVNDEKVGSGTELKEAVGRLEEGDEFGVTVVRSKDEITLEGEMDEGPGRFYSKGMPHKFDIRVPEIDVRGVSGPEMEHLKQGEEVHVGAEGLLFAA
jgi:S1-C subfamily serine protease